MTKILIDEATVKLALEALENSRSLEPVDVQWVKGKRHAAIAALREALAEQPAQQDSTCSNALRIQHKAYPRTCKKCGLGPCVELAQQPLDKKAENARELGLDYEPAQQEPVQNNPFDCGVYLGSGKDHVIKHHVSYGPARQEPVAWTNWRELVGARHYRTPGWEMYADKRNPDDVAIYTSPPAQRQARSADTWVGLTDEDSQDVIQRAMHSITGGDNTFTLSANKIWVAIVREVEAKLKEKNT